MADTMAFLLPFLMLVLGGTFLIVARFGSKPALFWGIGYVADAAAFFAPVGLMPFRAEIQAPIADALFLVAFFCFNQALLLQFGHPRRVAVTAAFCVAAAAIVTYAVVVRQSLRAELLLHDAACALVLVFALVSIVRNVERPVDKALFGVTAALVVDTVVRTVTCSFTMPATDDLDNFATSQYAFFMEMTSIALGLLLALAALAAVALDVVETYRDAAEEDPLTGLLNRRGFERTVNAASRNGTVSGAVVTCDIDHFKRVNDTFGHVAGDGVIAALACLLRAHLPDRGLAARFGGEEFVAFLPGRTQAEAGRFAETVRAALAGRSWADHGIFTPITASFGVAVLMPGERCLGEAILCADKRLYAAKAAGRNRVMPPAGPLDAAPAFEAAA